MSDIDWPAGWDRTSEANRRPKRSFDKSLSKTVNELEKELLTGLDVDDWRLETDARHQKRNSNFPYADASPDDPGAVVRWSKDGEQFAVACDRWSRLRDNVREVLKYLADKRRMSNRPVQTGRDEFANARLPPGDEEGGVAIAVPAETDPHDVLDIGPEASDEDVKAAFREKVKDAHPDGGGNGEHSVDELRAARDQLLDRGDEA